MIYQDFHFGFRILFFLLSPYRSKFDCMRPEIDFIYGEPVAVSDADSGLLALLFPWIVIQCLTSPYNKRLWRLPIISWAKRHVLENHLLE